MAVPVVRGRKSKKEQFAGAFFTTSVEVRQELGLGLKLLL